MAKSILEENRIADTADRATAATPACPHCQKSDYATLVGESRVELEILLRRCFVDERAGRFLKPGERKDLTDFVHGAAAPILECQHCGVLVRDETARVGSYASDAYDRAAMETLFDRYAAAFRTKEVPYRAMLWPGAEVLEVGPHLGGFLAVARQWSWKPIGADVDREVVSFLENKGFDVLHGEASRIDWGGRTFDGIFIWNCFEQIPDGADLLARLRSLLRPRGLLVLRVPNGSFYRSAERLLAARGDSEVNQWVLRSLGYNNLLAFPHLFGYTSRALTRMAARHGFEHVGTLDSRVLTLPFPELAESVRDEAQAAAAYERKWITQDGSQGGSADDRKAPWIEMSFRAG